MKKYAQPVAKSVELALCDLILTSEETQETPDLGDVNGNSVNWQEIWNSIG